MTLKLKQLIEQKRSNLIVAADLTQKTEIITLAKSIGDKIIGLKLHIDIVKDFDYNFIIELQQVAQENNFLLIEDRKFADIGSTEQAQYKEGIYRIVEWADLVTIHAICGEESINALESIAQKSGKERGGILVVQLSCKGNLIDEIYTQKAIAIAKNCSFIIALVAQESFDQELITCTPGVNIAKKNDDLGQCYNTPEYVIEKKGSNIIIVGRGIYNDSNPRDAAENYRKAGWSSYEKRHLSTF